MPAPLSPMLAVAGPLPEGDGWACEIKWDGIRALVAVTGGAFGLWGRNGRDLTARFPEVAELGAAVDGLGPVLLDGELVALDAAGRPSFERLQGRIHLEGAARVRRAAAEVPVTFVAFDLLASAGVDRLAEPYAERREALAALGLDGPAWRAPAHRVGDGAALLELTRAQGLEGLVAKRLDSSYEPGRRSRAWIKVRHRMRVSVAVCGWIPGEGARGERARSREIGALVLGRPAPEGLRYAGRVGSGLSVAAAQRLATRLDGLAAEAPPFREHLAPPQTHWVRPKLVCDVEAAEWTAAGTLRQPVFVGEREDVAIADLRDAPPG